ncbi:hypothetical protein EVAR_13787_1 [Eumeta japonica]|uniref:Uncharacterized protein n=1 Tax=Eumeta variegata TaxID=151549 RepID=A0A4C1U0Z7_EUMVA|nr:hypothetical protein EVAR_13787_1 [Eumeta japonica]
MVPLGRDTINRIFKAGVLPSYASTAVTTVTGRQRPSIGTGPERGADRTPRSKIKKDCGKQWGDQNFTQELYKMHSELILDSSIYGNRCRTSLLLKLHFPSNANTHGVAATKRKLCWPRQAAVATDANAMSCPTLASQGNHSSRASKVPSSFCSRKLFVAPKTSTAPISHRLDARREESSSFDITETSRESMPSGGVIKT